MINNAQQQSQKIGKKNTTSIQTKTKNYCQKSGLCPNCNAELPDLSVFCAECGFATGKKCPNCGAQASSSADICQTCFVWLLEGQCKFCYSEIPSEALFCPECGKPKDGIPCSSCGKLSIFDFCSDCGKPVTEEAVAELKRAQEEIQNQILSGTLENAVQEDEEKTFSSNQEARRYYNACAAALKTGIDDELQKLELLINSEPEPEIIEDEPILPEPAPPKRKSLFSDKQLASIKKTGAAVEEVAQNRIEAERIAEEKRKAEEAERKRIEEERKRIEEERKRREEERKRQEEERQRKIKEAQARKEELERQLRARRWRCNAFGNVHDGPHQCGDPSRGGQWV